MIKELSFKRVGPITRGRCIPYNDAQQWENMEKLSSFSSDTCVARLTPVTHSPSLLPAFEDTQNTVCRPFAFHF